MKPQYLLIQALRRNLAVALLDFNANGAGSESSRSGACVPLVWMKRTDNTAE
jgi:hypothetical protein